MGKYGNGMTTASACICECDEAREILGGYNVSDEDRNEILNMIKNAYFELGLAYASGRTMDEILKNEYQVDTVSSKFLKLYMTYRQKEEAVFFDDWNEAMRNDKK